MKRFLSMTWQGIPVWWLTTMTLVYIGLVAAFSGLVPFYDGGIYYASIERLVNHPFTWANLHMEGHPSPVYALLMAWSQFMWQGAVIPMFATNAALALFATVMMFKLLQQMFGRTATTLECCLGASIYGLMPVLLVHMFHINLDFGLSVFLVPYIYFLLNKRLWLAAICATAMMLTKETGVLIYTLVVGMYAILFVARPAKSMTKALWSLCKQYALFVPGLVFIAYYGSYRLFSATTLAHWGSGTVDQNLSKTLLSFDLSDQSILSFLANIFIINFNWLLTAIILACLMRRLWRWTFGLDTKRVPGVQLDDLIFLSVLCIGIAYITTRVRPWNNPRYVLAVFPLLVPLTVYCLSELTTVRRIREIILSIILCLTVLSGWRTIDPVSKAFYGTITFGNHDWLNMTSMIGPAWLRRDPQAYNFEFFQLYYAAREVIKDLRPPENAVILTGPAADFYFANWLNRETLLPTLGIENAQRLFFVDYAEGQRPQALLPRLPQNQEHIWFLSFPNLDNMQFLPRVSRDYRLLGAKRYGHYGYEVMLFTFERP